ncbi:BTAD domain-containing putative transcriptional regulator [Pseudonocardia broussonetiae]|uniref:AAA family ATPase n=1 Tax=Pseudonocardia broussonetiae TaxID=2736640 RepID=A0A6M6JIV9_9PSEU|nr:BTAD domain-containing putative transcriptional regulator [Pseudonocardia broussonetiae]QJY47105.1 AAA family ATPase [Pseudonocardia broussonetiae]
MLEVRLLGDQGITAGRASDVRPVSSRTIALLAHLVLHADVPQFRQRLAVLFWPDSGGAQARTNLRRELHDLRAALGDDAPLAVGPTTLVWHDVPSCRVDVLVFRRERNAASAARSAGDREAVRSHADAALQAYRGDLLPAMDDEWVIDERERLRRDCLEVCDLAIAAERECGDVAGAVRIARRRIRLEPLEEAGYRALMAVHLESGDVGAAVSTYHRCAAVLEQELGVRPGAQTTAVVARLLDDGAGPRARAVEVGRPGRVTGLVGRDRELQSLLRQWEHAAGGGGAGLVAVAGEAGVGKSRLVAELAAVLRSGGVAAATTRCFGTSGRLPLAPVAEWLRSSALQDGVRRLDPVWQVEVDRLVPRPGRPGRGSGSVRARPAGASRAAADAWRRHRFFEGLGRAVLSAERPVLLVLDDLHWCDPETTAWLTFLLGLAGRAPLLVAATVRPEEVEHNEDASTMLSSMRSDGRATVLRLAPLDPAGTAELARSVLGRPVGPGEQALLHGTTGGYPLFVVEAARTLPDDPTGAEQPLGAADLDAVLVRRLEQASPTARQVAGLAAAVGRDFGLDLLGQACDLDPELLVRAVDELWRRRILREQGGEYDFSHDLLRDAAYSSVSPPRRWLLHRRLAQGLEVLHAGHLDDVAAQLAEQYDRGGRPDHALSYSVRAAGTAAEVFAYGEAIRHYRRCLDVLGRRRAGRDRDGRELEILQAMLAPLAALRGFSSDELQSMLERCVGLADRLDRPEALLRGLIGLYGARFVQGHIVEAHGLATRALELGVADPVLLGQAHYAFAGTAASLGLPATAVEHFELSRTLLDDEVSLLLGLRPDLHAQAWSAHSHWLLGDDEQAAFRSADAVEGGRASHHPFSLAVCLAYAGLTHQLRDDAVALAPVVGELLELCRRYGFAYYLHWATMLDGWLTGGEAGAARIEEGLDGLRSLGAHTRMPYWLALLAQTLLGAGRRDAARAVLDAARSSAEQRDDLWWLPEVLRLMAGLESGPTAVGLLRHAVDLAAAQGSRTLHARCCSDLAALGVEVDPSATADGRRDANGLRTPGP